MKARDIRSVDPRTLLLPTSRLSGADQIKLQRQIAQFGSSSDRMPLLLAFERFDGLLVIWDGVTRATRMALLSPGTNVNVEVIGKLPVKYRATPSIGDLLP